MQPKRNLWFRCATTTSWPASGTPFTVTVRVASAVRCFLIDGSGAGVARSGDDGIRTLWALLDEGVLHRPVGGSRVMCEQLDYLLALAERPNIAIQIVSISAGCTPGLMSAFAIAEQLPGAEPDTVYVESAAEGLVTADEAIVNQIRSRYDSIRADAFPQGVWLTMIKDACEQWRRQF